MLNKEEDLGKLHGIVARLSMNISDHEDLFQEGWIFLVKSKKDHPDKKPSWHLKGCEFHVRHIISSGKSVDSWSRRRHLPPRRAETVSANQSRRRRPPRHLGPDYHSLLTEPNNG